MAGCGDDGNSGGGDWQIVEENLDSALMTVWSNGSDDVWVAGADDGNGPLVLHYDGAAWRRQDTGTTGDIWWIHGFPGGPLYLGGENGTILRYDGSSFTPMTTPGNGIVFGMWGASADDMWAVGGNQGGASGAFVWHLESDQWVEAASFPTELSQTDAMWKVFGRAADDVFFVGTGGNVLHYDGDALSAMDSKTSISLFTVHGYSDRIVAVGGFGTGAVIEYDGTSWTETTPPGAQQLIGVSLAADGSGYAVGIDGLVYRRDKDGTWGNDTPSTGVFVPLHSVFIDPGGDDAWIVGGRVLSEPLIDGVILHRGATVATEIQQ